MTQRMTKGRERTGARVNLIMYLPTKKLPFGGEMRSREVREWGLGVSEETTRSCTT